MFYFQCRYAHKFKDDQTEYRVLYKAFGLRIIISVTGTGGRFNIVPLMLTIGAGFGLMSLTVILADCVMLNCTKNKKEEQSEFFFNKVPIPDSFCLVSYFSQYN